MENEGFIRLGVFLSVLAVMAIGESFSERRERAVPRSRRWGWNFGLVLVDTLCLRGVAQFLTASLAVGAAMIAAERGWGLFNLLPLPGWIGGLISFLVLDFAIYLQHVIFHRVPMLWKLHKIHHTDLDVDVTTALRFHPVEIVLSMLIKIVVVVALGVPAVAVLLFEIVLNGAAMFNHANLKIPDSVDRLLRLVLVTPDMHRVHHSVIRRETDSNFGFNFPWWDRLCGTYRAQPEAGHDGMSLGLKEFRDPQSLHLPALLWMPFRRATQEKKSPDA